MRFLARLTLVSGAQPWWTPGDFNLWPQNQALTEVARALIRKCHHPLRVR
jgi:hypothetical protein